MAAKQMVHKGITFSHSSEFWEKTYRAGNTSGSGSYGRLAEFKAEVVNGFVRDHDVASVIDFGCGDGNQLSLADYPRYVGLDVSPTILRRLIDRFASDSTKSFFLYNPHCFADRACALRCDLAVSMDVIFHLIEDDVFEKYMRDLFSCAARFVMIYTRDLGRPRDPRVLAAAPPPTTPPRQPSTANRLRRVLGRRKSARTSAHVKMRDISAFIAAHLPNWTLLEVIPNRWAADSPCDFFVYSRRIDKGGKTDT